MTSLLDEKAFDDLIKKSQTANLDSFTPADISSFIQAFTLPNTSAVRSKAYVLLSALCQKARSSKGASADDKGTEALTKLFGPHVKEALSETNDASLRRGICTLHALFQVDWPAAAALILEEGAVESIMEALDSPHAVQLDEDVAHLLGQASGHKRCREVIPTQAVKWLEAKSHQSSNLPLRAAAAVALVKYSKGVATDASEVSTSEELDDLDQESRLADMMQGLVVSGDNRDSISDAVEALAYLSTRPEIKETLSLDSAFLRKLFSLVSRKKTATSSTSTIIESALAYGVLVIISNVCAYRPRLSEEQAELEKLKKMAQGGKKKMDKEESSVLESDARVKTRVHRMIEAGALGVIGPVLAVSDSPAVRLQLGKTLLNIVEDKENRGKVLQSGGAKTLSTLIKQALGTQTTKDQMLDAAYLDTVQALAKLAITSSPLQVFGPDVGAVFDTIRPFSILLQHPSSTLLQRFEATMALTNLSSYQPQIAERIAQTEGLLSRIELLMLEDHVLVRRSAVELICNLVAGSDDVFERYGGASTSPNATSKLQILVALADVDDLPTVLAASGALAALTCSPHACKALAELQQERKRVLPVFTQLIDPSAVVFPDDNDIGDDRTTHEHPGLVHRGLVCIKNLITNVDSGLRGVLKSDAKSVGLVKGLVQLVKGEGLTKEPSILMLAVETLKAVMEDGT
ncbi:hypothetical protein NP233_g8224 [Leucocoprinus birnbaumii]|uniref:UNC-45/Cro1/She4 central domain-containing protein n=1 Tax=Leucocoprinus birnbaumii TaxID=56174 RepID=A0AAD5VMV5_9AGAR|nr:hypothetical protein NP233_g8224 [Leucocoprinus birnbaumii]